MAAGEPSCLEWKKVYSAYETRFNNPQHFTSLSVWPGKGQAGTMFLVPGVAWIYVFGQQWGQGDFLFQRYFYDWSILQWVQFQEFSAHPSVEGWNYNWFKRDTLLAAGVSKAASEDVLIAADEVLAQAEVAGPIFAPFCSQGGDGGCFPNNGGPKPGKADCAVLAVTAGVATATAVELGCKAATKKVGGKALEEVCKRAGQVAGGLAAAAAANACSN